MTKEMMAAKYKFLDFYADAIPAGVPIDYREYFEMTFKRIKDLCYEAYENGEKSTFEYFIRNGIPRSFMDNCMKCRLCAGGKNGTNLFWNWSQNKMYPKCTVDNFLAQLPVIDE